MRAEVNYILYLGKQFISYLDYLTGPCLIFKGERMSNLPAPMNMCLTKTRGINLASYYHSWFQIVGL